MILGSQEPRPIFSKIPLDGVWIDLGPQDPPKTPQDLPDSLPRPPQILSKADFLVILEPLGMIFWRIFGTSNDARVGPGAVGPKGH